jgi:hypothetical protein
VERMEISIWATEVKGSGNLSSTWFKVVLHPSICLCKMLAYIVVSSIWYWIMFS